MSITSSNFVIYQNEYFQGYTEILEQAAIEFEATRGAINFSVRTLKGLLESASFFQSMGDGIVMDRDPDDVTAANWNSLSMSETKSVRVFKTLKQRKTLSAFRLLGEDPAIASFVIGQQDAKAVALSYLNSSLASLVGGIGSVGAPLVYDATALTTKTLTPEQLVRMLEKMGDASGRIVCLVMHSKTAFDLLADAVTSQVSTVAGPAIFSATFGSLGLPVLVTDSPALALVDPDPVDPDPTIYRVLALTEGAINVTEDSARDVLYRLDDSAKNLIMQMTTEFSYDVAVKGMEYTGASAPGDSALINPSNYTYKYSDIKSGPGILGLFNGATVS
jgi:hypothetical protein